MKQPTKAQVAAFHAAVQSAIGREPDDKELAPDILRWTLQTDFGPVLVSIHDDDHNSVYTRFLDHTDPVKANWRKAFPDANQFSGKNNIHGTVPPRTKLTREDLDRESEYTVAEFRRLMRRLGVEPQN